MPLSSTSAPQIQKRRGRRAGVYNNPENGHKALATAIRVLLGASVLRYVPHYGGRHIPVDRCKGIRVSNFRSERTRNEAVGRALRTVRAFFIDVDQHGRMVPLANTENESEMNTISLNPKGDNDGESVSSTRVDLVIAKVLHPDAFGYTVDLTIRDGELNDHEGIVNAVPTDAQDQAQFQGEGPARFPAETETRSQIQTETQNQTQTQPQTQRQPQSPSPSRTQTPAQAQSKSQSQAQVQAQTKIQAQAQAQVQTRSQPQAQLQAQTQSQNHAQNHSRVQPQGHRPDESQGQQQVRQGEPQGQQQQQQQQQLQLRGEVQAQVRALVHDKGHSDQKPGKRKEKHVEDKQPIAEHHGGRQLPCDNQRGHGGKRDLDDELRAQHAQHAQSLLQAQQTQEQVQAQMRIGADAAEPEAEEQHRRLARVEEEQRHRAEQHLYQSPHHYDPRVEHAQDAQQNIHVPPIHVPSMDHQVFHHQQQSLQPQFLHQHQQSTQAQQYQLNVLNNNSNQQHAYHMPIVPHNHSHSHIPGLGVEAHDQLHVHGYDHTHALHPTQLQLHGHASGHGHYVSEASLMGERAEMRTAVVTATVLASSGVVEREEKKKSVGMILRGEENTCVPVTRGRADWINKPLPDICAKIMNFPQPFKKNCSGEQVPGTPKCDPDHPMMFAQYGEDYFLYTRHFVHMKKPGFYLDIAANHPISISNTYFLDRCLGWSGICVEGNSKYFEHIHRERSCGLVPTCVSDKDGETVDFMLSGPGSGIVKTHRQGSQVFENEKLVERKKCVTVSSQLRRFGQMDIDYFNLDIEGGELNALKSIDWNVTRIKVISVEIAHKTEKPIDEFLVSKGFKKIDTLAEVNGIPGMPIYQSNRFYVHSSGVFGQPW